jgi:hypothetical protein
MGSNPLFRPRIASLAAPTSEETSIPQGASRPLHGERDATAQQKREAPHNTVTEGGPTIACIYRQGATECSDRFS